MSRDIRSYFTTQSKHGNKTKPTRPLDDSDDENIVEDTPDAKKKPNKTKRKTTKTEEDPKPKRQSPRKKSPSKKLKESPPKLKPVNIFEKFKNAPINQSKVVEKPKEESPPEQKTKTPSKGKKKGKKSTETAVHKDEDFEKTLCELDDDDLLCENVDILEKSLQNIETESKQKENQSNGKQIKKRERTDSPSASTPSKKKKIEHTDSGIDPDLLAYEKRRHSALLYQQYKNRAGPKHHGSKELPKGKPDCLKNITFLRTGVLDSLESQEFENLITEHGGHTVKGISKKVNYVVVGDDPGPSKLEKAQNYGIKTINEDELLDMILKKSGMATRYVKVQSTDSGISEIEENVKVKSPKVVKTESKPKPIEKSKNLVIERPKTDKKKAVDLTWTEKYKPNSIKSIIAQQNNVNKLRVWLQNWEKSRRDKVKPKPSFYGSSSSDNGAGFRCALLSGPPGVGKTTTATLLCKELGYDVVEFNASDTRSKKSLQSEVSQLLSTRTLAGFAHGNKSEPKRVLLMDEVDGMAGNEDRGGMQELIALIKTSHVPVVCMCNDRQHQKIRSLANYCFDLRFNKPTVEQIRGAMMSICAKENVSIEQKSLDEIIEATGCDIRQTLNYLSVISCEKSMEVGTVAKKNTVLGPWEVIRMVFTESGHETMSLGDKMGLFFHDYSLGPLFVQQNYLNVQPHCKPHEVMERVALAADAIARGDMIDAKIRRTNNWSLLEMQAIYSSVLPGHYMSGHIKSRIDFPAWLGKNSTKNKVNRIVSELQMHTRMVTSGGKQAMRLDYVGPLRDSIIKPLKKYGNDGVEQAVNVMKGYNLLREDLDNLVELSRLGADKNPFASVDSKVKAAFTRAYNKSVPLLPFASNAGVAKKKSQQVDEFGEEGEYEEENEEEKDDVKADGMIKVKTKDKKESGKGKASSSKAGSSKGRGKGKK